MFVLISVHLKAQGLDGSDIQQLRVSILHFNTLITLFNCNGHIEQVNYARLSLPYTSNWHDKKLNTLYTYGQDN